ncbi:MAG: hypothetical protein IJQ76_05640 [Prevotella sp.]|nr:hypothetical protein [Prevotella sp.]MBR0275672.1 hypothetical protein [Prevotella sp.]
MTTFALNNLWSYLQGLSLAKADREWLAGKLLEPSAVDLKTRQQQEMVKESLTRALNEVKAAKRGEVTMMTEEAFLEELKEEGLL